MLLKPSKTEKGASPLLLQAGHKAEGSKTKALNPIMNTTAYETNHSLGGLRFQPLLCFQAASEHAAARFEADLFDVVHEIHAERSIAFLKEFVRCFDSSF